MRQSLGTRQARGRNRLTVDATVGRFQRTRDGPSVERDTENQHWNYDHLFCLRRLLEGSLHR